MNIHIQICGITIIISEYNQRILIENTDVRPLVLIKTKLK